MTKLNIKFIMLDQNINGQIAKVWLHFNRWKDNWNYIQKYVDKKFN